MDLLAPKYSKNFYIFTDRITRGGEIITHDVRNNITYTQAIADEELSESSESAET